MPKLDEWGNLDYADDPWEAPPPPRRKSPTDPNAAAPDDLVYGHDPNSSGSPLAPGKTWADLQNEVTTAAAGRQAPTPPPAADNWDEARVSQYFQSRGVTPNATSPKYWADKWNEWGKNDPEYFQRRLAAADEFGGQGGAATPPPAPAPKTAAPPTDPAPKDIGVPQPPGPGLAPGVPQDNSPLSGFLQQLIEQQGKASSQIAAQRQGVLDRIRKLSDSYAQPVTAEDPTIQNATSAYEGSVNRSVSAYKKQAAERAYAEGVPSGAFDSQIGNATLSGGRAVGDFQSQLMMDELKSRRAALSDLLSQEAGVLTSQDSSDLNNKIAAIDAALRDKGIGLSDKLGSGSLNLQDKLGSGALSLQSRGQDITKLLGMSSIDLQRILGQGALDNQSKGITNQNNQFYDKLGLDDKNQNNSLDSILATLLLRG